MTWVFYALITAFSLATADAISKKAMDRTDEYVIAWVREGYALPFLAVAFFFVGIPHLDSTFWLITLLALPLEITAVILYVKAIRLSPLSLTIPFLALSPVFIIVIAFLLLGEFPDRSGLLGIILITLGGLSLKYTGNQRGYTRPHKGYKKRTRIRSDDHCCINL